MTRLVLDTQSLGVKTPNVQTIMLTVIVALAPGIVAYAYFVSAMVLVNIVVAVVAALLFEMLASALRGGHALLDINDASIALAAVLLALAVPPMLPIWQLLVGVLIMVMLGKHVYGGLGHNPFNPAMVGYAALLISFPQSMTLWMDATELRNLSTGALVNAKFSLDVLSSNQHIQWDGITQATPLDHARSLRTQALAYDPMAIQKEAIASGWLWINLSFLIGGLFLLYRKIIQWHIPASLLCGFLLWSLLFSDHALPIYVQMFSGALILGAFFIATDPVTAASSNRGRLVYGFGIGSLTFVIREYGGYPEGIAFAVLLMNLCVPLIDHLELQLASKT